MPKLPPIQELPATRSVIVPELSFAVIPHGISIKPAGKRIFLMPKPGVFMERHLLVSLELITGEGELITKVFNLSASRVRIGKGEAVSQLVTF